MAKPLRALLVEDSEADAALLLRELSRNGYEVTSKRVDTPEAFATEIVGERWEIIFCDYSMPRFDAPTALRMAREKTLDVPFIIVSGTVGEETAVEAMRAGAHDYFLKGKLAPRLVPAVERELREALFRIERQKMQDQLMISDRMVSMGTLAAGVAHEINNPLASVIANIELATRELATYAKRTQLFGDLDEMRDELRDAREGAERIRNIVRDLKIFSRAEAERRELVDVHRVLESTLRMAWNEIRHRAKLVKDFGKAPFVEASESRLGQVFLNLVVNAAQAIPEGSADRNEIRVSVKTDDRGWLVVDVADTGAGMPPEVLARLFTPFFTTKPIGVGTGLGLSICHRIVDGFGGSIEVESEVGKGTRFRVSLPPARAAALDPTPEPVLVGAAAKRRGHIMAVDDEAMITRAIDRMLSAEHEVTAVTSAAEALRKLSAGQRFDVILCDLMMPEMTGMDLHAELRRSTPDQADAMVFMTGGTFTPRARAFLDGTPNHRIEKPFGAQQLRAIVNDRIR